MIGKIIVLGRSPGNFCWSFSLSPFLSVIAGIGLRVDLFDGSGNFLSKLDGVSILNEKNPWGARFLRKA